MTLNEQIDDMYARLKAGEAVLVDRQSRINMIDSIIEDHFAERGRMPGSAQLERLGSLILYEELTDMSLNKRNGSDEPFHSRHQTDRRQRHERSFKLAEEVGSDRVSYRKPTRDNRRKF